MSKKRSIMPATTHAGDSSVARCGMPAAELKCLVIEADRLPFGPLPEDPPNRNTQ